MTNNKSNATITIRKAVLENHLASYDAIESENAQLRNELAMLKSSISEGTTKSEIVDTSKMTLLQLAKRNCENKRIQFVSSKPITDKVLSVVADTKRGQKTYFVYRNEKGSPRFGKQFPTWI